MASAAYDGGTPLPEDPPMPDRRALLHQTADLAADYLDSLETRPVAATATRDELLEAFGGPMPARGEAPGEIVDHLGRAADPGIVASAGPRYFGFVIGGSLPSAVAADWLTTAWDQNGFAYVMSPAGSVIEEVTAGWLLDAFGLPRDASVGFASGATMATFTGLAAGRHRVLQRAGWDVEGDGLIGAPEIAVVARRRGPRDRLRVAPDGRAREPPRPQGRGRRAGPDAAGSAARGARRGRREAGDRGGPVGQREHRRLRPAAGDRGRRPRAAERVAPRRRRVRAVGGRLTVAAAPRRGPRRRGLVDHRRPQVAQRPVRLRDRRRRPTPRPTSPR